MGSVRKIRKVLKSRPTLEGAGVRLKRVFGYQHVPEFDPFLLLDDFHSDNPDDYTMGFPWHPHRGIETITYMIAGRVEHGDSMGNRGVIYPGDVQWMTAGSGIIHQEMPRGDESGNMWGFQLWANLPASSKMMEPRYREIRSQEIPETVFEEGASARVISGEAGGVRGPAKDVVTAPEYLDVTIPPEAEFRYRVRRGHNVIAYIIEGEGRFQQEQDPYEYEVEGRNYFDFEREEKLGPETLVHFEDGDEIEVSAGKDGVRFLLAAGKPIGEPVAWQGPIVMNTREELKTAFEEFRNGNFIR